MTKTAKPVRTVPAVCACGASFSREVKRGRPQVWCPACLVIPFYERQHAPSVAVATPGVEGAEVVERIVNEWDQHDAIRGFIEEAVQAVYDGWAPTRAAMIKAGASEFDVANAQRDALANAYKEAGVR